MSKFRIQATWQMIGWYEIEAPSMLEAIAKVLEPSVPLPDNKEYSDGSFQIDAMGCEEIQED
jgi:hypothetical protein